jgi:hypothetical protein
MESLREKNLQALKAIEEEMRNNNIILSKPQKNIAKIIALSSK